MASPHNKQSSSQAELKKAWYHGMHKFEHGIYAGIKSFYIAKVVKYDKSKHIADVLPLANWSDGTKSAQYLDVPVIESCYLWDEWVDAFRPEFVKADKDHAIPAHDGVPAHSHTNFVGKLPKRRFMRAGVPVVVAVLDRDNDNWGGGRSVNTFTPNSGRIHDANDSVIIGVLGGNWLDG